MSAVSVALLFPADGTFDHERCRDRLLPLLRARLGPRGMISVEAHRGLCGDAPGTLPPFACMLLLRFASMDAWREAFAVELEALLEELPELGAAGVSIQVSAIDA